MEDWLRWASGVPKHCLSLIIAGCEHAIVELIEAHILDFPVMEVEVGQRPHLIALLSTADVPDGQFAIVAASDDLPFLMGIPLKRVSLSLMPREHDGRRHSDGLVALGGSAELDLIEDMNLSERGARGDEVGLARMVPNAVDFPIMLDLVLHHYLISHAFVVLPDSLC